MLAVVDDAQWLDRPTADALAFVVRRLGDDRVAFVICARDGYETPFGALDLPVDRARSARRRALRRAARPARTPPRRDGCGTGCCAWPVATPWPSRSWRRAPGGPARARPTHGAELPMTARLERAFTSRYAELPEPQSGRSCSWPPPVTRTICASWSAPRSCSLPGVAGDPDLWTPAVDADLVTVWEQRVEFRHPLVRSAIYQSATSAQRVVVHTALATSLEAYPDRRVWHRGRGDPRTRRGGRRRDRGRGGPRRGARRSARHPRGARTLGPPDAGPSADAPTGSCVRRSSHWSSATRRRPRGSGYRPEAEDLGPRSRGRLRLLTEMLRPSPTSAAGVAAKANELIAVADEMFAQGDADLALAVRAPRRLADLGDRRRPGPSERRPGDRRAGRSLDDRPAAAVRLQPDRPHRPQHGADRARR